MARNKPYGDACQVGSVRNRSQTRNPKTDRLIKRDAGTGLFINQKADKKPFKGVRREK